MKSGVTFGALFLVLIALDAHNWECLQLNEMKEEVRDISQLWFCSFFSAEQIQIPASAPQ